jgi:hypothetical protein
MAKQAWPQSTIEEIVESEAQMVRTATERFGEYYQNAWATTLLLSRCVASIDHTRLHFGRYHALTKKHHTLAVLSIVRLHKAQAMMNLRQALEAGCAAAFAIANPEDQHFFKLENGLVNSPQKLTDKRYRWLEQNFKSKSDVIKWKKDLINSNHAHTNIVSAESIFQIDGRGSQADAPFFDREDDYFVKGDLWLASTIALELADWFFGINKGLNVMAFAPDFIDEVQELATQADALQAEIRATERFKAANAKWGLR